MGTEGPQESNVIRSRLEKPKRSPLEVLRTLKLPERLPATEAEKIFRFKKGPIVKITAPGPSDPELWARHKRPPEDDKAPIWKRLFIIGLGIVLSWTLVGGIIYIIILAI